MIFQGGGGWGSDIKLNEDLLSDGWCLIFYLGMPYVAKLVLFFSPECQGAGVITLILSSNVGLGPASTVYPKKCIDLDYQAPKKFFKIYAALKNIPILYIYLKKRP